MCVALSNPVNLLIAQFLPKSRVSSCCHIFSEVATFSNDSLYAVVYHGSAADREVIRDREWHVFDAHGNMVEGMTRFQVLITSYDTLRSDIKLLSRVPWHCLVVDEAHRIKSTDSVLRADMARLPCEHIVLMTGTPIQNRYE